MRHRHGTRSVLSLILALSVAGCGAGFGDTVDPQGTTTPPTTTQPSALAVATKTLPGARASASYEATLVATGATGPALWRLRSGALPEGLHLDSGGRIAGTPARSGIESFVVEVTDARATASAVLRLSVDTLDVQVDGLTFGDAWTQTTITVTAIGAEGSVAFSAPANESGGRWLLTNGATGIATWQVGSSGGAGIADVLRIADGAGRTTAVTVPVMPHPAPNHRAEFGSSDVWHVAFDGKFEPSHSFRSDWHHALAMAGLRVATSTHEETEADALADFYVRREVLRCLNVFFLRNGDGSRGDGLAISFPFEAPEGRACPAPGAMLSGGSSRYSRISVIAGSNDRLVGTAFVDASTNDMHENNTTTGATGDLGVFVDRVAELFNFAYRNTTLPSDPVNAGDVEALRALVYGLPSPGGRHAAIRQVADGLARSIASVCAHEIGHSLSLSHTEPSQDQSIMNGSSLIAPFAEYRFIASDLTALRAALPGRDRTAGLAAKYGGEADAVPQGGVHVCCQHGHAARAPSDARPVPPWAIPLR